MAAVILLCRVAGHTTVRLLVFRISGRLRRLHDADVPLQIVESALLLASLRRLIRPADLPPLTPIRSLAYFQPVIDELLAHPMPDNYLEYLRLKLNRIAAPPALPVQKNTFSDDR